jgi:predicted hotdog family 3-hydroxylacyl-ACP dehydratase
MSEVDIRQLVPHQGSMCLLERVLDFDANMIRLSTLTHRDPLHPLRARGRLHAIHLCEYGAQAMAVHGGLRAQSEGGTAQPGFLVSLRDVKLTRDTIDDLPDALIVTARCLHSTQDSFQYEFEVSHAGELIASGRAAVITKTAD